VVCNEALVRLEYRLAYQTGEPAPWPGDGPHKATLGKRPMPTCRYWRPWGTLLRKHADRKVEQRIRDELAKGTGIQKTAGIVGVGCGTVQRIKGAMAAW